MSDSTRAALEAALEAHLKDENDEDDIVSGYVIQVCTSNLSDMSKNWYGRLVPGYQPYHSSVGLVEILARSYAEDVGSDDDD